MNLHAGGHVVTRSELALYEAPPPTATWRPTSHSDTHDLVTTTLEQAGYRIEAERLAVHKDGARGSSQFWTWSPPSLTDSPWPSGSGTHMTNRFPMA